MERIHDIEMLAEVVPVILLAVVLQSRALRAIRPSTGEMNLQIFAMVAGFQALAIIGGFTAEVICVGYLMTGQGTLSGTPGVVVLCGLAILAIGFVLTIGSYFLDSFVRAVRKH